MEEKYSFEDWYSGKVNLDTEPLYNVEKDKSPIVVCLNSFSEQDQKRIIETKTSKFKSKVNFQFELFWDSFLRDFEKSKLKIELINQTIIQINNILNPKQKVVSDMRDGFWNVSFEKQNLIRIKEFAHFYLINGTNVDYLFEHSENSKFNLTDDVITNEVYASSLYLLNEQLKKFKRKYKSRSIDYLDKIINTTEVEQEPQNLFPAIFVNGYGYDLFDKIFELIVDKDKPTSSISFIFHSLKLVDAIKDEVNPIVFMKFICLNKGVCLDETKLHNRPPNKFLIILRNLINTHYKGVIEFKESRFTNFK
jgi:hypothetical protein